MPIKLKTISATILPDPLEKHLNNILSSSKEKMEYAEKRLKAACAATDLIKKNTDIPEKISKVSDPLKIAEVKDALPVLAAAIDKTAQVNQESQQTINEYLSDLRNLRKENQLIYGKRLGEPNLSLGFGSSDMSDESKVPYYKKKLLSTDSFTYPVEQYSHQMGAVEFAITYDNTIFIVPKSEGAATNNLYRMSQGALLKAVGCIQIGNREVIENTSEEGVSYRHVLEGQVNYISVYNAFFDAEKDNIAVSLFALQELGIDLSATKVVIPNDNAPLVTDPDCRIAISGEIKDAAYYLDENRFPRAKALATENLSIIYKIKEIFCSIDDEVLSKRNKNFVKKIYGEIELLKLNMANFFSCAEEFIQDTQKVNKTKVEASPRTDVNLPTTSSQVDAEQNNGDMSTASRPDVEEPITPFNGYWQAIKNSIQFFKGKNIDLTFLVYEINSVLAYLLQNVLMPAEKHQLKELTLPERIPGRGLDIKNISAFISFYEHDPIKTCINLLRDYSKGQGFSGALKRFFSLAWNRHYIQSVNQFLIVYDQRGLPDNLTVGNILSQLQNYGAEISLRDDKSTLLNRLLFCVKLNGEENDFIPELVEIDRDLGFVPDNNVPQSLLQLHESITPIHSTPQPISTWVPTAIATMPPPLSLGESPTGSFDEDFPTENLTRKRSQSVKFFLGDEGDNPDVIQHEQGNAAANSEARLHQK